MRGMVLALIFGVLCVPGNSSAQGRDETLADIRQELSVLYVEIQKLKRELSTSGAPSVSVGGSSVLDRVSAIEVELQHLTQTTEELEHRVERVVTDGTNRIGDLEFRLVELEGGDVSKLGETTTLGGATQTAAAAPATAPVSSGGAQLAVGEQADFDAASAALEAKDYQGAANRFAAFLAAYPGSPLTAQANVLRGRALDELGDTREAARAYLAGFSADATGPVAPDALAELGGALGRLGQTEQACVTLGEVELRFPQSAAVARAQREMSALGCS